MEREREKEREAPHTYAIIKMLSAARQPTKAPRCQPRPSATHACTQERNELTNRNDLHLFSEDLVIVLIRAEVLQTPKVNKVSLFELWFQQTIRLEREGLLLGLGGGGLLLMVMLYN